MGLYVEVKEKERWLEKNGQKIAEGEWGIKDFSYSFLKKDHRIVSLVHNPTFTAAAVARDIIDFEKYNK